MGLEKHLFGLLLQTASLSCGNSLKSMAFENKTPHPLSACCRPLLPICCVGIFNFVFGDGYIVMEGYIIFSYSYRYDEKVGES